MISTLKREITLTLTEQSKIVKGCLEYLCIHQLWEDDEEAYRYFQLINSGKIKPCEEYEAFSLCCKYRASLKKADYLLPTKAQWQNTYALQGMKVWNLTKRSGPYNLSWLGDSDLACDCPAGDTGVECSHVKYALTQLDVAPAAAVEPEPAPIVYAAELPNPVTNNEILPGIFATPSQAIALNDLIKFTRGEKGLTYLLSGYAGCGKTLLVQALIKHLRDQGDDRKIVFTAPTNKATGVLARMVSRWGLEVECITCASLLGLKPSWDAESGKEVFVRDFKEESTIQNYDLVVIDESSMVNEELFDFLMSEVNLTTRLLFMGDPYQLPPVNEAISESFTQIGDQSNLSEVMRYEGAIAEVVADARINLSRRGEGSYETSATNGEGVFCVSGNTWTQQLIKAFKSDSYLSNPDAVRALAYTNKRVEKINEIVRDEIRGNDAPRFVIGERLIAKNHYYLPNSYGAAQKVFSYVR